MIGTLPRINIVFLSSLNGSASSPQTREEEEDEEGKGRGYRSRVDDKLVDDDVVDASTEGKINFVRQYFEYINCRIVAAIGE